MESTDPGDESHHLESTAAVSAPDQCWDGVADAGPALIRIRVSHLRWEGGFDGREKLPSHPIPTHCLSHGSVLNYNTHTTSQFATFQIAFWNTAAHPYFMNPIPEQTYRCPALRAPIIRYVTVLLCTYLSHCWAKPILLYRFPLCFKLLVLLQYYSTVACTYYPTVQGTKFSAWQNKKDKRTNTKISIVSIYHFHQKVVGPSPTYNHFCIILW